LRTVAADPSGVREISHPRFFGWTDPVQSR
jgi:hypothetical protein